MAKWIFCATLFFSSIVSSGGLAHLFSLPNKINMPAHEYLIAQKAYNGWALFSVAIVGALISLTCQIVYFRKDHRVFILSVAAMICLLLSQVIFWTYTYPANRQTQNWTSLPTHWNQL